MLVKDITLHIIENLVPMQTTWWLKKTPTTTSGTVVVCSSDIRHSHKSNNTVIQFELYGVSSFLVEFTLEVGRLGQL